MKKVILVILWAAVVGSAQISFAQPYEFYNFNAAAVFEKLADSFRDNANDSLALYYYHESLARATAVGDNARITRLLSNIGSVYLPSKKYDKAIEYQQRAMQRALFYGDTVAMCIIYTHQCAIQHAQHECKEALTTAQKALILVGKRIPGKNIAELYFEVYKIYGCLSDYKQTYDFQAKYVKLNDSLHNVISTHEAARLHYNYELDRKETAIATLQEQHDREIFRRNAFIGALVVLLIMGGLIYNRQKIIFGKKLMLKKQRLDNYTQRLVEKSEMIRKVNEELDVLRNSLSREDIHIHKFNEVLNLQILTEEDWESFKVAFEGVHPGFFGKLRYHYPDITVSELRLAALIKLKLTLKESAAMLGISPESVKKSRYRLKKKLEVPDSENVDAFIIRLTA
jgi:tetratricopeptide (TPR) repeat protein